MGHFTIRFFHGDDEGTSCEGVIFFVLETFEARFKSVLPLLCFFFVTGDGEKEASE